MKKFIFKSCMAALLVLCCVTCLMLFDTRLKRNLGPNTSEQLNKSFEDAIADDYECYFLGNSRIYRGINPEKFTDMKTYNFAHDNDSYNQMYYKLLYLEKNSINFKRLVIGTDYFQFSFKSDTRNYVYNKLLGDDYANDFQTNNYPRFFSNLQQLWDTKRPKMAVMMTNLQYFNKVTGRYLKDNGQYIVPDAKATEQDTIKRDSTILDFQYEYFEKIIDYCLNNNVELYVIMPPVRDAELRSYEQNTMDAFNQMIENALGEEYKGHYVNCSNIQEFKDYTNYQDITHLTPEVADRFSVYLSQTLNDTQK